MSHKSASIEKPQDLQRFLKDRGYIPLQMYRSSSDCPDADKHKSNSLGKGSHEVWVHPGMARLLRELSAAGKPVPSMPANMRSVEYQSACNVMLCRSPGRGTVQSIVDQVEWCYQTLAAYENGQDPDSRREAQAQIRREIRENMQDMTAAKRIRSMFQRALSREFQKHGAVAASRYMQELRPDLSQAQERISASQTTVQTLKSRLMEMSR